MFKKKYGFILAVLGLTSIACTAVFSAIPTEKKPSVWKDQIKKTERRHSILTLSGGAAFSGKAGNSKFIPIVDPVEDQFFNYVANSSNQTKLILGATLGIEFLLNQGWNLQSGFSYYQPMNFHADGIVSQGVDILSTDTFSYNYTIQAHQVLFENKLLYSWMFQSMPLHPYVSAGIGISANSAQDYTVNIVPPFTTFSNQFADKTNTSFSYRVGLGIDYDVTNRFRVGVGYRFSDFGKVELGNASINQVPTQNNLSQSHLYTNEVLGQLTVVI